MSRNNPAVNEVRGEVERRGGIHLRSPEGLDGTKEGHQGAVLREPDEVVQEGRDDSPDGLRQNDEAHRLEA